MRIFKLLSLLGILFIAQPGVAQRIEAGVTIGVTNFQGDLTHGSERLNFSNSHSALGFHAGFVVNNLITLRGKIISTAISGYDNQARAAWRLQRNLHFRSSLLEAGINVELYPLQNFLNSKLQPYIQSGINIIQFDPKAMYEGEWVALQPLGTEGQGHPDYPDREKYSLVEYSIPLGIGLRYTINNQISISADFTPRWTTTDYLDDVSTTYIPNDLLLSGSGELAANLAYRGGELGFQRGSIETRGNSKENDWYVISSISFIFKLKPTPQNPESE